MPRKSCLTNLLESFQDWIRTFDGAFGIDIIYLDYKKLLIVCLIVGYCISWKVMVYPVISYRSQIFLTKDIKEWLLMELTTDGAEL